ncbi:MAG: hypothetical protein LBC06_02850 [Rickettsiales bacterium]|jgi:hypothetical protein|nr:hypothetical protein [Rickettsiales bacterium]
MEDRDMTDNFSNDENALFKAQIREADLAANQKLQEIQGAADEFARQAIINKLKQAEVEREKLKLELEQEASGGVDDILSYVELRAEGDEGYFADNEMVLESFWQLFKPLFDYFKVDADFEAYRVIKEKEKEGWLAAIIKFLRDIRDALKELIKKIFSADLSWDQSLEKEIKELEAKLNGGKLSEEEFVRVYERLESLQRVKLRLQMCLAGCFVIIWAELLSAKLVASVETTKEEGKEKSSAKEKEATKEVHEIIEIKLDTKGRYQIVVPSYLLDFSSGVAKPITLTKQEFDLLPKPLANLVHRVQEYVTSKENSWVKETKVNENKQAKSEVPKPVAARSKKEQGKVPGVTFYSGNMRGSTWYDKNTSKGASGRGTTFIDNNTNGFNKKRSKFADGYETKDTTFNNKCSATSNFNGRGSKFTGGHETDSLDTKLREKVVKRNAKRECAEASGGHETNDPDAKLTTKVAERNARKKCAEASTKHDYPINTWVPSEITDVEVNSVKDQSVGRNDERTGMSRD